MILLKNNCGNGNLYDWSLVAAFKMVHHLVLGINGWMLHEGSMNGIKKDEMH